MLNDNKLLGLHTNQRLLVMELQKRGVEVNILDMGKELLEAEYKGHKEFLLDRDSSICPYPASIVSGQKYLTKTILNKAGLKVTKGQLFYARDTDRALEYAKTLKFPLVVKPNFGSHGDNVQMNLENIDDVSSAIVKIIISIGNLDPYIVEEQFEGKEYRVFVTRDGRYAVLHRDNAHVIGDGRSTVKELASSETKKRMKASGEKLFTRKNCLCPISLDEESERYLSRSRRNFSYVPKRGEKVYLRPNSNVAAGAMCENYTDKVHRSVIDISMKALRLFPKLPYAGVDFLTKDVTKEQTSDSYRILEINSVPGIHMHMRPGKGKPENVASYIADMIFPETAKSTHQMNLSEGSKSYHSEADTYEMLSRAEDSPGKIAEFLREKVKGREVLDIGCGSGKYIAELAPHSKRYHGIDISKEQLGIAKQKIGRFRNVKLTCCRAEKLDIPKESYDLVILTWVIGTIADVERRRKAVSEACRVLRKGGAIYLVENDIGGEFEMIRGRFPDIVMTKSYNDWLTDEIGFIPVKRFTTHFSFDSLKSAKEVIGSIWGEEAKNRVSNRDIEHKIVIFEKKKL